MDLALRARLRRFKSRSCDFCRGAPEIKHRRWRMISPGRPWPGIRLLKGAFQQPARRLRAIGTGTTGSPRPWAFGSESETPDVRVRGSGSHCRRGSVRGV